MTEYDPLTMLSLEELQEITNMSGLALYKAETKRIPSLTSEEQQALLQEARTGNIKARNRVLIDCLTLTIRMAAYKMRGRNMRHSDITDLLGVANVTMFEKFPKALEQADPRRGLEIFAFWGGAMHIAKHSLQKHAASLDILSNKL